MTVGLDPADLFDLRFVRDARLSPDGRQAVYAVSSTDRAELTETCVLRIIDLVTGDTRLLTGEDGHVSCPRWSPDGSLIAYVEKAEDASSLMVVPAAGGPPRRLGSPGRVVAGAPSWSPDGRRLAVAAGTPAAADRHVIRVTRRVFRAEGVGLLDTRPLGIDIVDVDGGGARTLVEEPEVFHCTEPRWSPRGDRVLFLASFDPGSAMSYFPQLRTVDVSSGAVRDVLGAWGGCRAAEWLPDGHRIAFLGAVAGDRSIPNMDLWVVGDDGVPGLRSTDNPGLVGCRAIQDMPIWDLILSGGLVVVSGDHAYVTVQSGGEAGIWKVSLDGPPDQRQLVGGERTCIVLDGRPDTGPLFVATDMLHPTELHLAPESGEERRLTSLNDKVLDGWPPLRSEHLRFSAHDGLALEGWFLTREDSAGPQPTVLNLHQGPYTSVGHAFRFDLHLLASNGFSVMFANFRGSTGYGQEFMDAIGDDWGNAGFPDHLTTIDTAIERGLADPDRLGVWGASHGGFATSWVVGHTGRFAAAVAEAAITDFTSAYYTCDIPDVYIRQFGGRPHEVPDLYRARSPLTFASNCTTPILMLHCEGDVRCPLNQAEAFHRAVLDAGGVSEIAVIRGGNHLADAMGVPSVRLAQNEALLDWFVRHLPREQR